MYACNSPVEPLHISNRVIQQQLKHRTWTTRALHSTEKLPRTLDSSVVVLNLRLHSLLLVVVLDLSDLTLLGWSGGLLGLRLALSLLGGLLGLLSVRRVAGDLGSLLGWGGDFVLARKARVALGGSALRREVQLIGDGLPVDLFEC